MITTYVGFSNGVGNGVANYFANCVANGVADHIVSCEKSKGVSFLSLSSNRSGCR